MLYYNNKMAEHIPNDIYWPHEYKVNLRNVPKPKYTDDWYKTMKESFDAQVGWKKITTGKGREKQLQNMKKVKKAHEYWLWAENKFIIKCQYYEVDYIEPCAFPTHYMSKSERKMSYLKNYYWVNYQPYENNPDYAYDWYKWQSNDEKRRDTLTNAIYKKVELKEKEHIRNEWYKIPDEVKETILQKERDIREKVKRKEEERLDRMRQRAQASCNESQQEYYVSSTGAPLFREPGWDKERWDSEVESYRQALRDF